MDVEVFENKFTTVRVSGNVEIRDVIKVRTAIEEALSRSPNGLIIDLSDVDYIDSAGVSALVFAYRQLVKGGGKLAVIAVRGNVKKVLSITRLDALPGMFVSDNIPSAESMLEAA